MDAYSFAQGLRNVMALGQLGGGLLGMPSQIQRQTEAAGTQRQLLESMLGLSPELSQKLSPAPPLQFLNPSSYGQPGGSALGGTFGKLLEGIGTTGTMLSTLTGGDTGTSRMPLETITALAGLQDRRAAGKELGAHRERQYGLEERRTAATERQADAAMARATTGGGRAAPGELRTANLQAERNMRLSSVDTLGLKDAEQRARYIEKGELPKNAPPLDFDFFYKQRLAQKDPMNPDAFTSSEDAMRAAFKDFQTYQRAQGKLQTLKERTTAPTPEGEPSEPGALEVDLNTLPPAARAKVLQIIELVQSGRMEFDEGARKIAQATGQANGKRPVFALRPEKGKAPPALGTSAVVR